MDSPHKGASNEMFPRHDVIMILTIYDEDIHDGIFQQDVPVHHWGVTQNENTFKISSKEFSIKVN